MFSYECVLAAVLLTAPIEAPDLAAHLELIQPTFLRLAIDAEVLDPREEPYLQGLSKDPVGDYRVLRQRFDHFLSTPSLDEAERFPPRQAIEEFLAFNRGYRKDLCARLEQEQYRAEELRAMMNEVDQLYHLWSTVRDAKCGFYYVTVRRQALAHLRDLTGAEAYYRGQLPPHVPLWHFPRLR
jgi:hypothetical protein